MAFDPVTAAALGLSQLGSTLVNQQQFREGRPLREANLANLLLQNQIGQFRLGTSNQLRNIITQMLGQGTTIPGIQRRALLQQNLEASQPLLNQIAARQTRKTGTRSPLTFRRIADQQIPLQAQFSQQINLLDQRQMQNLLGLLGGMGVKNIVK